MTCVLFRSENRSLSLACTTEMGRDAKNAPFPALRQRSCLLSASLEVVLQLHNRGFQVPRESSMPPGGHMKPGGHIKPCVAETW